MNRNRALDHELKLLRDAATRIAEGTPAHERARAIVADLRKKVDDAPALPEWKAIFHVRTAREQIEKL